MVSVLLVGLLPWCIYSIAVPLLANGLTNAAGLLLVIAHAVLVATERFNGGGEYSNNTIYLAPVIMAVVVLPLAVIAMKRPPYQATQQQASES